MNVTKRLQRLPRVICLHLKRFKTEFDYLKNPILKKIEDLIQIDETLNVTPLAKKGGKDFELPVPLAKKEGHKLEKKTEEKKSEENPVGKESYFALSSILSPAKENIDFDNSQDERNIKRAIEESLKEAQQQQQQQQQLFHLVNSPNNSKSPESGDYRLVCVLKHHGSTLKLGHYTCDAFVEGKRWMTFDDSFVTATNKEDLLGPLSQKQCYVLFYQHHSL